MNELAIKFITDVVKPWETLNAELSRPYSIDPAISDFSRTANAIAVSVKHIAELNGLKIKDLEEESKAYRIMSDIADASKHGALRDERRNNSLTVGSMFEGNEEKQFRFLRNVININHNTYGKLDFMEYSKDAALFTMQKLNIKTDWKPNVNEGQGNFVDEVILHATNKHQVAWKGLSLQFVKRDNDGTLKPFDPPQWKFNLTSEF